MESCSVIVPVYNCKKYLESCISSIVAMNDFCRSIFINEIILVDDGSTDGSAEQCDELSETKRTDICSIQVIHQTNRGVSAARNAGLKKARSTFIIFVDSDDTIDSQKLAELLEIIGHNSFIDMAIFGMSFDYYSGDRIYRQDIMLPPVEGTKTHDEFSDILYSLFQNNVLSSLCNKIIRKEVIENSGLYLQEDMFLYEDLEFSLRILAQCRAVHFYPKPIYRYRQAEDEGNAGRRLKKVAHIPELVFKIEEALGEEKDNNSILLALYLTLAREKISVSSKAEIKTVCNDFKCWIDDHTLLDTIKNNNFAQLLYQNRSSELLFRKRKTIIRHVIANRIKKTLGDFRKW